MNETKHDGKLLFPPWVIDMMHEYNVREAKRNLETYAHFLEEMRMSETKHDGSLGGEIAAEATVEYDSFYRVKHISINGGYGYIESRDVTLDAKQALSLLAWLRQEESKLEGLAKEQAECG